MAAGFHQGWINETATGAAPRRPVVAVICGPEPSQFDLAPEPIWPPSDCVHTKNRKRSLQPQASAKQWENIVGRSLEKMIGIMEEMPLLSDEHFCGDGRLLRSWTFHAFSIKLIRRHHCRPPARDWLRSRRGRYVSRVTSCHGQIDGGVRFNGEIHRWWTEPQERLARQLTHQPAMTAEFANR